MFSISKEELLGILFSKHAKTWTMVNIENDLNNIFQELN